MTTPTLILTPRRGAVLAGFNSTVDVLVRVQAPEPPANAQSQRSPLHLGLVIDRSGSMSGQPLHEAKRAAAFVIDGLGPADHASLVIYDDNVETLVPLTEVRDRQVFHRALRSIHEAGSTDLHGGWFRGAETLAPATSAGTLSRVILLSDGCANHGLTDPDAIFRQCAELAAAGVATSTYGLGRSFNEDLMIGMAKAGLGSSYYGQTADDLMDPFREELALLNALCAKRLVLELRAAEGVQLEVLNDYRRSGDYGWHLPDLAYGGEAWALVRLTLARPAASPDPRELLSVSLRYADLAGEPRAVQPASLALPALPAAAFDALAGDELVARRADELQAARLQLEAQAAARQGDWAMVDSLMQKVAALGADNPWVEAVVAELRDLASQRDQLLFAKATAYGAHRMSARLAPTAESPDFAVPSPRYLRRKRAQGKAEPDGEPKGAGS